MEGLIDKFKDNENVTINYGRLDWKVDRINTMENYDKFQGSLKYKEEKTLTLFKHNRLLLLIMLSICLFKGYEVERK